LSVTRIPWSLSRLTNQSITQDKLVSLNLEVLTLETISFHFIMLREYSNRLWLGRFVGTYDRDFKPSPWSEWSWENNELFLKHFSA
jgi:hypothetical protein